MRSLGYVFFHLDETRYAKTTHKNPAKLPSAYVQHLKKPNGLPLGVAFSIREVQTFSLGAETVAKKETRSFSVSRALFGLAGLIASEYFQT